MVMLVKALFGLENFSLINPIIGRVFCDRGMGITRYIYPESQNIIAI